jgi:hypothetical protein
MTAVCTSISTTYETGYNIIVQVKKICGILLPLMWLLYSLASTGFKNRVLTTVAFVSSAAILFLYNVVQSCLDPGNGVNLFTKDT